ncbi:MAG: histidine phosphatase family protein [Candidatus Dormibacteria bacterium]
MRLWLVRHGESTWNRDRRVQGQSDPPLSPLGLRQARAAARALAPVPIIAVYSSDLERAARTADEVARPHRLAVVREPRLREVHVGAWEGLTRDDLLSDHAQLYRTWREQGAANWDLIPGGEGTAAFRARVDGVIDELVLRHPDGDIAVVAHGGVVHEILTRHSPGYPEGEAPWPRRFGNASFTVLEFDQGEVRVVIVDDRAHLEGPGEAG